MYSLIAETSSFGYLIKQLCLNRKILSWVQGGNRTIYATLLYKFKLPYRYAELTSLCPMICLDSSVLYLDSPFFAMWFRNCLQAESQGSYRTHLICFPSHKNHSLALLVVQYCLTYVNFFQLIREYICSSYSAMARNGSYLGFLLTYLNL